jgi:hypothetical protein
MLPADLDPATAATIARLDARRAAILATERTTQALYQTLEIARDHSNETRALRACQALLRGHPLPELLRENRPASPARRTPAPSGSTGNSCPSAVAPNPTEAPPSSEPQASACAPAALHLVAAADPRAADALSAPTPPSPAPTVAPIDAGPTSAPPDVTRPAPQPHRRVRSARIHVPAPGVTQTDLARAARPIPSPAHHRRRRSSLRPRTQHAISIARPHSARHATPRIRAPAHRLPTRDAPRPLTPPGQPAATRAKNPAALTPV